MIAENILCLKERINAVCARVGRSPSGITVIAVTKGREIGDIQTASAEGICDIGENRVKEAQGKYEKLKNTALQLRWHLVGHLQTNKVREAVRLFDLIHSVDSVRLAVQIDKAAAKIGKVQNILLEVKTSPEESKFGVSPDMVPGVIQQILRLRNIRLQGFMTLAPSDCSQQAARPYFRLLRELKDSSNTMLPDEFKVSVLSMGMTDDYEVAIEEGATMVRVGRGIFHGF